MPPGTEVRGSYSVVLKRMSIYVKIYAYTGKYTIAARSPQTARGWRVASQSDRFIKSNLISSGNFRGITAYPVKRELRTSDLTV